MNKIESGSAVGETVHGFKAFSPDLTCRGFQFEIGKEYEENDAVCCSMGFHFCENPMDLFEYYPPTSRFTRVTGSGKIDRTDVDSKISCTHIKIEDEITLEEVVTYGTEKILENIDLSIEKHMIGYPPSATNTGYRSAATNTGYLSAASVSGKESVAMAIGYESKAKGSLGCWIVLAEHEFVNEEYHIKCVKTRKVDGKRIKADTFYELKNGVFVIAQDS